MIKGSEGYYLIVTYKEPQEVGGKMINIEVFQHRYECGAVEHGKELKKLPYVENVSLAKALLEL